jgi:hypothetical protein
MSLDTSRNLISQDSARKDNNPCDSTPVDLPIELNIPEAKETSNDNKVHPNLPDILQHVL